MSTTRSPFRSALATTSGDVSVPRTTLTQSCRSKESDTPSPLRSPEIGDVVGVTDGVEVIVAGDEIVAVGVGVCVTVGETVGVGVRVGVSVAVGVTVDVGVRVGVAVVVAAVGGVAVPVEVGVGVVISPKGVSTDHSGPTGLPPIRMEALLGPPGYPETS